MRDWPHSPAHRLAEGGTFLVTAATYKKQPFFNSPSRLTYLVEHLFACATQYDWRLQAWAVFSNHYHFVAQSPTQAQTLRHLIQKLHSKTAIAMNTQNNTPGRTVWFEYWESRITYQKSYLARLSYVHGNAVHHGLVRLPSHYPWCSAGWFERKASKAFFRTVSEFPSSKIKVPDDFAVPAEGLGLSATA